MPDADVDGPEWLSPLLLVAICTSCIGLAGIGAGLVLVAGAFWANVGVGVLALGLFVAWLARGSPLRDRGASEAGAGSETAEDRGE